MSCIQVAAALSGRVMCNKKLPPAYDDNCF